MAKPSPQRKTEVIFFDVNLIEQFEEIFSVSIELDAPEFFDFDQEDVEEDTFYDMLDQEFEIDNFNLTDIEKFGERPVDTIRKMNPGRSIPTGRELAKMLKGMTGDQEQRNIYCFNFIRRLIYHQPSAFFNSPYLIK